MSIKKIFLMICTIFIFSTTFLFSGVDEAVEFIHDQLDKYPGAVKLVASYDAPLPPGVNANQGYLYDSALAVIALLASGREQDKTAAKKICNAIMYVQDNNPMGPIDGRLLKSYNVDIDTTSPVGMYDLDVECGNLAWTVIALLRYYTKSYDTDTVYLKSILTAAERIGDFIEAQLRDAINPGYYVMLQGAGAVLITNKSTEHNMAAFAAFNTLYLVTGDSKWSTRADYANQFIEHMWNSTSNYYHAGTHLGDGWTIDTTATKQAVDVQAFSILISTQSSSVRHNQVITWAQTNCSITSVNTGFEGFDFNTDKDGVWFEGTAQMAMAYAAVDDTTNRDKYLLEIASVQIYGVNNNGKGIVATSSEVITSGFGWSYYPSLHVGASAWYIAAVKGVNMFWGTGSLIDEHFSSVDVSTSVTWHGLEGTYKSTGAAVAQMIVNYMQEGYNKDIDPDIPLSNQDAIYEASSSTTIPPYNAFTPKQMHDVLEALDPYSQGYNFLLCIYESDQIEKYMRDICHWLAYKVKMVVGAPGLVANHNTPVATVVDGDPTHWVAITGCITDVNPTPNQSTPAYQPDFTVFGFWIRDPLVPNSLIYKSADSCRDGYFATIKDELNSNKFYHIAEPPEVASIAKMTVANTVSSSEGKRVTGEVINLFGTQNGIVKKQSVKELDGVKWQDIIGKAIANHPTIIKNCSGAVVVSVLEVDNIQESGNDYCMVFLSKINSKDSINACMILDANDGSFIEIALFDEPISITVIDPNEVIKLLKTVTQNGTLNIKLVWEKGLFSNSTYFPFWVAKSENSEFRVKKQGSIYKQEVNSNNQISWRLVRDVQGNVYVRNYIKNTNYYYNNNSIEIQLDRRVKENTINNSTVKVLKVEQDGLETLVPGKIRYDRVNNIIYFDAKISLESYNSYKLVVSGIKDTHGDAMDEYCNIFQATTLKPMSFITSEVMNYPNPFAAGRENTKFAYTLAEDAKVTIVIYSAIGNLVKKIICEPGTLGGAKGNNEIAWDGKNGEGYTVGNGMYIAKIIIKEVTGVITKRIRKVGVVR